MKELIDRQAAVEVADAIWMVTGDKNVAKVWQQIKDLPTAEPKKGKWIENNGDVEEPFYHCSVCEWDAYTMWDFCPKCGADMRGEEE